MYLDKSWREERKSKKIGIRDGRAGIPTSDWSGGPVPYLSELHAKYAMILQRLHLSATNMVGQSVHVDHKFAARTQELKTELIRVEGEAESLVSQLDRAIQERDGLSLEAPEGKIARRRGIPTSLYIICLLALIVGEYLVTVPAIMNVFGDSPLQAYIVSGSIAMLSVILAHLFGISLKERLDRNTPQPVAILWGFGALATVFLIALLFLSAMRADIVDSNVTLGLSNKAFGTIMFFVLQLTFIGAATGLAFYNHSELDARIKSLMRRLKRANKKIARVRKAMAASPANRMNSEKVQVQRKALIQEFHSVTARYEELAAIYARFNILNQRNKVDSLAIGLTPKPLPNFDETIAIEMPKTNFDEMDNIEDNLPPRAFFPTVHASEDNGRRAALGSDSESRVNGSATAVIDETDTP